VALAATTTGLPAASLRRAILWAKQTAGAVFVRVGLEADRFLAG